MANALATGWVLGVAVVAIGVLLAVGIGAAVGVGLGLTVGVCA